MPHDIACFPENGAEAAGVPEAKDRSVVQHQVDVIMLARRVLRWDGDHPEAARHAQMQDESSFARVEQKVFPPPRQRR